jgi:hypothetical protein
MGHDIVGVYLPSARDGNRSSFRNVVFSSYLEFRTIDKFHKTCNSEYKGIVLEEFAGTVFISNRKVKKTA